MSSSKNMMQFENEDADPTLQFWTKFAQLSETNIQFRRFILEIAESSDAVFMNINLDKARNICYVIEARIAAEAALADL